MVYVHWRTQEGLSFGASSVAPPVHPDLRLKGLRSMSGAHFGLRDPDRMAGYLRALAEATPEEIELGRLQIRHFVAEIGGATDLLSRRHPLLEDIDREETVDALAGAVEGVAADALLLLKDAERRPSDVPTLKLLQGAMSAVAEAEAMTKALSESRPVLAPLASRAAHLAHVALSAGERMREAEASRRPEVAETVWPTGPLRSIAALNVALHASRRADALVPGRIDQVMRLCGPRGQLWVASQADARDAEIATGRHRPLDAAAAERLRDEALDIGSAFDAVFNANGFAALVLQASVAARWDGLRRVARSLDSGEEDRIRARYARVAAEPGSEEAATMDAEMRRQIGAVPARRAADSATGQRLLKASEEFAALVRESNPGLAAHPVLFLRALEDGGFVGTFEGGGRDEALVVRPDPGADGADAVRAVIVDGLGDGEVPELAELEGHASTNYGSVADALGALVERDPLMSRLAGGGPFVVLDLTAEGPAPAPGPQP